MNIITSLWTGCDKFRIDYRTLLVATYSHCLARKAYKDVTLITDQYGAKVAELLGWKFSCVTDHLQCLKPNSEISHIWAMGKVMACLVPTTRFMQYDWDVLLYKKLPEPDGHFFCQSVDDPLHYRKPDTAAIMACVGLSKGGPAYNMGVMGGDPSFMRIYAEESIRLCIVKMTSFKKAGTSCSILAEQYFAGVICEMMGVRMGTLFRELPTETEAKELGYVHLQGTSKHRMDVILKVKGRMEKEFPDELHAFQDGFAELEDDHARKLTA